MIVPYKIKVEIWGLSATLSVYIGKSEDEPLPADFKGNAKYVAGIMTALPGVATSSEWSYSMDAAKGPHYIVVGIQPQDVFGLTFPYTFYVKYTIQVGNNRPVEIEAPVGNVIITEQKVFAQVTFNVLDYGVEIVNYGTIYPGQAAINNPASSSSVNNLQNTLTATIGEIFKMMMPMMMFMAMMQLMMGMIQSIPAVMAGAM